MVFYYLGFSVNHFFNRPPNFKGLDIRIPIIIRVIYGERVY